MTVQPRILVVVATYNEIENLPQLVAAIHHSLPAANILVVDDNSPDGTGDWVREQQASDPLLDGLHREGKQGLGSATVAGFRHAIDHDYEVVCTLDADFSHDPRELPRLVDLLGEHDVAIGSRYCGGGKIEGWPLTRRVVSKTMNMVSRLLLRLPASDTSGAFRAYRVEKLKAISLEQISSTGYAYLEEIVWLLHHAGARFAELPITFRERTRGRSKVSAAELGGKLKMLASLTFRKPPQAAE